MSMPVAIVFSLTLTIMGLIMVNGKGKPRMKLAEIEELLELKGWSRTRLAAELDITENAVQQWFGQRRRNPGRTACVLMQIWLAEARKQPVAAAS